ncbi:MAG: (2Fe-2S)-binding protein [Blastocatellia bacterium]|nr:(2Fe-2S)-binding protein [Blastocatellia bacterium]
MTKRTAFEDFLHQHDDQSWMLVIAKLLPDMHQVDRRATEIWFSFWPYTLNQALTTAPDLKVKVQELLLGGSYFLKDNIDTSHEFFYGHRYWPQVKEAIVAETKNQPQGTLEDLIRRTAQNLKAETNLVLGITAVGYMTLQQVGLAAFNQPAKLRIKPSAKSPEQVLKNRARDEGQGLFGFLRTINKQFTVCFNENDPQATFKVINNQPLTTASTKDTRNFKATDARCVEGPIPIECQTGACGTCWVGVLGGNENASEISDFEIKRLGKIGYPYNGEKRPPIRLACKTVANGPLSLVILTWNGVCAPLYQKEKPDYKPEPGKAKKAKK